MRVCLVSSSFYPAITYGGPISATWDLSKELSNKGIDVYVSTTNANGKSKLDINTNTFIKKNENLFVKYYNEQVINKLSISFIVGVWSDIKKSDIIYIQYLFHYTVFISVLFSFFLRKKVVICPRGSLSVWGLNYKHKWIKKIWLNFFIRPFVANVIWQACSYLEVEDIKNIFKNSEVVEINDGIDFDSFQGVESISKLELVNQFTNQNFKKVSEVFFSMGRLHEIKGFDVIIDAFFLFVKKNPNAKLLIAGSDDGFETSLRQKIEKLNLLDSVFLIGAINHENKCKLLSNCSAFALASKFESFGIVIAEALASGVPVIISNKTPWKDIENNNCGIFTENNKNSFYHAFCKIKEKKFNSVVIKKFVKSNFDWNIIVKRFIKIIGK
jgi:glycosyltransferase involved in cell wall biosynthesis